MSRGRLRVGPNLNWAIIVPVVSGAVLAVGLGLAMCFVVAVVGGEGGAAAFGLPAAAVLPLAGMGLASARRLPSATLRPRDGFSAVTLAWLASAVVGSAPFLINRTFAAPVDAFFESMSGLTTTGATLLATVESEPDSILLWRSLSQWIGGVGIVVLVVAIAPATGLAGQRAFYAETSGVTAERLTPRIADTAKIIWAVYLSLTALSLLAYLLAGMTAWDAVNHSLTTVATGGFSTRTASIAAFDSLAIELVAIVFMTAGGVNFAFYWLALRGRDRLWPQAAEVRAYLLIIAGATVAVTAALMLAEHTDRLGTSLRSSAFAVVSVITSTGYTTVDFDEFPDFARVALLLLMFVGGCAGSTAGGMKVIRIMLLGKAAAQEVQRQLQPSAVQVLRLRGRVYPEAVRRGVFAFFGLYVTVFAVGTLSMAAAGLDPVSAAASVSATLNVIGPGLGDVGATENFAAVPESGRWILSTLMLIGRLEVFTVLVLLTPAFWRPSAT
jgi:trk system potassium uptake protein TrkH